MSYKNWRPGRLVCPHCGYDGTSPPGKDKHGMGPFTFCRWIPRLYSILEVEGRADSRGVIIADYQGTQLDCGAYENWVIVCNSCSKEFSFPDKSELEWATDEQIYDDSYEWPTLPGYVHCKKCLDIVYTTGKVDYHCNRCGATTRVKRAPE
jgi:hypothetical protein